MRESRERHPEHLGDEFSCGVTNNSRSECRALHIGIGIRDEDYQNAFGRTSTVLA